MSENKLQVNDLRISFRTQNGKVQAVRGISFDLKKGETLAIVGESGSGKSVTSKAILGILAGNAIIEGGEIIYDGQDLIKISEEEFHRLRGDKIAMIFQDPMSSLNPIVRIGKQLTEAMLLKGKVRRKESRKNYKKYIELLRNSMYTALSNTSHEEIDKVIERFNKTILSGSEVDFAWKKSTLGLKEALEDIDILMFELEKKSPGKGAEFRVSDIARESLASINEYVVKEKAGELSAAANSIEKSFASENNPDSSYEITLGHLNVLKKILTEAAKKGKPDFEEIGFNRNFPGEDYKAFIKKFSEMAAKTLEYSAKKTYQGMRDADPVLVNGLKYFEGGSYASRKECETEAKKMIEAVDKAVDPLAIHKDSFSLTFKEAILGEIEYYYKTLKRNKEAEKVYKKEKKKYDRIIKSGKKPAYELAAAGVTDPKIVEDNITRIIRRLRGNYQEMLAGEKSRVYSSEAGELIQYLNDLCSESIEKINKKGAKERAIRLMSEVGIPEPHKRYRQYPFEFSGGMRQRIVIAIALAANPDILICDEPTTALDVTIQAQILELINKLKEERKLSVIFITHDLGVVANMADRVAVMYAGKIVEYGTSEDIFYESAHPYTWALLSSMPDLDTNERLEAIPGTPPNMIYPPVGDAFAARNKYAMQIDFEKQPPMFKITDSHYAATWLLHPDAPKVNRPKVIDDRIRRMRERSAGEAK